MTTTETNLDHRFGDTVGVCDLCGHVRYQSPREWLCSVAVAESTIDARQAWLKSINAYYMASFIDIATPASLSSKGAEFLDGLRYYLLAWFNENDEPVNVGQVAEYAVPIYTHDTWETFVDLCAYNEDIEDWVDESMDMNQRASMALYSIAERYVTTFCELLNFTTDRD
jgi:hypothetical protein